MIISIGRYYWTSLIYMFLMWGLTICKWTLSLFFPLTAPWSGQVIFRLCGTRGTEDTKRKDRTMPVRKDSGTLVEFLKKLAKHPNDNDLWLKTTTTKNHKYTLLVVYLIDLAKKCNYVSSTYHIFFLPECKPLQRWFGHKKCKSLFHLCWGEDGGVLVNSGQYLNWTSGCLPCPWSPEERTPLHWGPWMLL